MSFRWDVLYVDFAKLPRQGESLEAGLEQCVLESQAEILAAMQAHGPQTVPPVVDRIRDALHDLCVGRFDHVTQGDIHAFALWLLCRTIGEIANGDDTRFVSISGLDEVGCLSYLTDAGPPIDIGEVNEISVGHLTPQQVRDELEQLDRDAFRDLPSGYRQTAFDYADWLEEADRMGEGLVAFLVP